jgi:hypothetical protein
MSYYPSGILLRLLTLVICSGRAFGQIKFALQHPLWPQILDLVVKVDLEGAISVTTENKVVCDM